MSESLFIFLNIVGMGPERAHGLRAFTALGEGPSLASSTHIGCLAATCNSTAGDGGGSYSLFRLLGLLCSHEHTHTPYAGAHNQQ